MDEAIRVGAPNAGRPGRVILLALTALLACWIGCDSFSPAQAAPAARESLIGLFRLDAGSWHGGASGTYFRMLQPDGRTYLTNTSSSAGDKTYTLLVPGTDGGLRTGRYQPTPNPAFAANGDALSGRVTAPTDFYGVKFATATNKKDPQTADQTALPVIKADGTSLSGNLSAFAASWNNQNFNQGSPKPDGSSPGFTQRVSGTYNPSSRAFTLTWRSLIVGGPFNKFTGEWHLSGTFVPDTATPGGTPNTTPTATLTTAPTHRAHSSGAPTKAVRTVAPAGAGPSRSHLPSTTAAASAHRTTSSATTSAAALPSGAAAGSAAPQHAVAAGKQVADSSSRTPWLVGGGLLAVALGGLLAFWLARTRGTQP